MSTNNDRITELEIQIAHQNRVIEELSDEIHRQDLEISRLKRRMDAVLGHLQDQSSPGAAADPNQKPPHW